MKPSCSVRFLFFTVANLQEPDVSEMQIFVHSLNASEDILCVIDAMGDLPFGLALSSRC